ncbi:MAG: TonB-dependent receptor, partial [Sphingomicrobium sp.]
MTDRTFRAAVLSLLATTALATPAWAQDTQPQTTGQSPAPGTNATDVTAPPPTTQVAQDGNVPDQTEIIITATKREENLQNVPISVQAIGTRRLDQLNISNFEQYTKQLPSVSFQSAQPGVTVVYMRGVATGGDGNHSGSLPSVGSYLDEQPVTTIGGTLDVHIYDIARIESLAGPQGTLYGASSEAGTIRIITNKPELGVTTGRVDAELNTVNHGDVGGKLEGMINIPIADRIAFRGVAFWQHDAGYIDNIHGERTYYIFNDSVPDVTVTNSGLEKKNNNDLTTYGGRAALKVDLNDNWTATPTFMYQNMKANGVFFFDPNLGENKIDRFRDDVRKDKFWQAAMTIQGKIANFDVTYAGAYMDRKTFTLSDYADYADAYDQLYQDYGGLAYFYYNDAAGNFINPQQFIIGTDHFKKMSQELRFASPSDKPFRVIAGLFYQRQSNLIHQDYKIDNLDPLLSVNGHPGTLWLTQQKRIDKDYAAFGEASFDVTPQITLTAGGRWYKFDNSLIGFFGFGRNPGDGGQGPFSAFPRNAAGSNRTGVAACWTASGQRLYDRDTDTYATDRTLLPPEVAGGPCTNLGDFVNGKVVPKRVKDTGFIHRLNATWKPHDGLMFYATWSRGFRPGGINRRGDVGPYDADFLSNYELGWKTTFGPVRWNGAIYHQKWNKFQFSFLGQNSF